MTTDLRTSVYSEDFDRMGQLVGRPDKINEKTLDEWNAENSLTGVLEALKNMGWDSWQWRWTDPARISQKLKDGRGGPGCFIEVFGHHYSGYIRADASTLNECGRKALEKAQRMVKCEIDTGHSFDVPKGYTNGYFACEHCGFGGYQPLFQHLKREIETLRIQIDLMKENEINVRDAVTAAGFGIYCCMGASSFELRATEK